MRRITSLVAIVVVLASGAAAVFDVVVPALAFANHDGEPLAGPPDADGMWAYCNVNVSDPDLGGSDTSESRDWSVACQYGPTSSSLLFVRVSWRTVAGIGANVTIQPPNGEARNSGGKYGATQTFNDGNLSGFVDFDTIRCRVEGAGGTACGVVLAGVGGLPGYPEQHWPGGTAGRKPTPEEQLQAACLEVYGDELGQQDLFNEWAENPADCLSDPVNTATGAFETAVTDLTWAGPGVGFAFSRAYSSSDTEVGPLGRGWTHVYGASLSTADGVIYTLRAPDGQRFRFTGQADGSFVGDEGALADLRAVAGGHEVTRRSDRTVLGFDVEGRLVRVRDAAGEGLDLAYDAGGLLAAVEDTAGQRVQVATDGSGRITSVALPDGRAASYGYSGGLLTSVTAPDGAVTTYQYDAAERLVRVGGADGNTVVENVYGPTGRVVEQRDALGNVSTFALEESDGVRTVAMTDAAGAKWTDVYSDNVLWKRIDPLGRVTEFGYSQDLRLSRVTDPAGKVWSMTFDAVGNLLTRRDPLAGVSTFAYDGAGRLVSLSDALGATTALAYDPQGAVASVTDALGNVTAFDHDAEGNVVSVTDGTGAETTMAYDAAGRVTGVTDPLGATTTFSYDSSGFLISVVDPLGAETTYVRDTVGRPTAVTDPLGHEATFEYDGAGRLLSIVDSEGGETTYAYNAAGEVVSAVDALGNATSYEYDGRGDLVAVVDALGGTTICEYNARRDLVRVTDALGHATTHEYDPRGLLTTTTDALGGATRFTYDAAGRRVSTRDPLGNLTTFALDPLGRTTMLTNPLGDAWRFEYDALGRTTETVDPLGNVSRMDYDEVGRVIATVDPLGQTSSTEYDAAGQPVATISADGARSTSAYDAAGRRIATTDPMGGTTEFAYDAARRLISLKDPIGAITAFSYDRIGRLLAETDPAGAVTAFAYDALGRRTRVTDANGRATRSTYDELGRLTSVIDPLGGSTVYEHDALGNLLTRTDANGHETSWAYDPLGREIERRAPTGERWTTEYDAAGRRTRVTDASGNATPDPGDGTTTYRHDAAGRLTAIDYADEATYSVALLDSIVPFEASEPTPDVVFRYDAAGRRIEMSDGQGEVGYVYDAASRLFEINLQGRKLEYDHDAVGRIISRTYPDGREVTSEYDRSGRLTEIASADGTTAYVYDPAGRLVETRHPNDTIETRAYDDVGRVRAIATPGVAAISYTYDPVGNPVTVDGPAGVEAYAYDGADRLTEACYDAACTDFLRYEYDAVGNRLREDRPGATATYSYDDADRLTERMVTGQGAGTTDYAYDPDGNLVSSGVERFAYDAANRLVAHLDGVAAQELLSGVVVHHYAYDGEGRRVRASTRATPPVKIGVGELSTTLTPVTVSPRTLTWDPSFDVPRLVSEAVDGGGPIWRFTWGRGLALADYDDRSALPADAPGEGAHVPHADRLGSVVALSDDTGAREHAYAYEPFGAERPIKGSLVPEPPGALPALPLPTLSGADQPFRFTGEYLDDDTGLYDQRARLYDPTLGRFTTLDPLEPLAGEPDTSAYAYVNNRPTVMVDPTGMRGQSGGGGLPRVADWASMTAEEKMLLVAAGLGPEFLESYYDDGDAGAWDYLDVIGGDPFGTWENGRAQVPGWAQGVVGGVIVVSGGFAVCYATGVAPCVAAGSTTIGAGAERAAEGVAVSGEGSLGSTGRTVAANLTEQLAMQEARANPLVGVQLPIGLSDPRWPTSEGWVKMARNINGVEIHYVLNTVTGAVDDFKFVG